jgi:dihydroneopterin aldolase
MDRILLSGVRLEVHLGVGDAERAVPQTVIACLECEFNLEKAGRTDDFTRTIDYGAIHQAVREAAGGRPYALVEALAESIASAVLARFPVDGVRVLIRKPAALASSGVDWAGVEILRRRRD